MLKKDFSLTSWRNFIRGGCWFITVSAQVYLRSFEANKSYFQFVLYLIQFSFISFIFLLFLGGFLPVNLVLSSLMVLIWVLPLPFSIYCIPKYTFLIKLRGGLLMLSTVIRFMRSIFVSTLFFSYLLYSIIQIVDKLRGGVKMD